MNTQVSSTFANYNKLRKRKRLRLYRYLSPIKPEVKQWNCISGTLVADSKYDSIAIMNILQPINAGVAKGSWELIPFKWPTQGYDNDDRIGNKFALKWIIFRGYASISGKCAYKCNYKLILIKSQNNYVDMYQFLSENYFNYQFPAGWTDESDHAFTTVEERKTYGRHNYYKLVKNVTNQSEFHTSIKVIAAGTFTPDGGFPSPTFSTTLGSNPAQSLYYAGYTSNDVPTVGYYPLNVKLTCNDNIDVSIDHYYLALLTDVPVGHTVGATGTTTNFDAADRQFSFNFFTLGYYIDP